MQLTTYLTGTVIKTFSPRIVIKSPILQYCNAEHLDPFKDMTDEIRLSKNVPRKK
jgi:hypothetical protein